MLICAKPGQVRHTKFPYKCYFVHMILHGDSLQEALMDTPDFWETDKTEVYNPPFTRLMEHQRIKKAINLLITTGCCLTEIAFACGFFSQSYFSYVFKRRTKQTPREYVQEFCSKYEI